MAQIAEEGIKNSDAAFAAWPDLVFGDDLGIGIERARVVDPVADALEGELLARGRDADLVAGEMDAEEGAENRAGGTGRRRSRDPCRRDGRCGGRGRRT